MLLTEYDEAKAMELFKEEGLEEGRAEGIDIGAINTYVALVEDGVIDMATAAQRLGVTEPQFRDRLDTWTPCPSDKDGSSIRLVMAKMRMAWNSGRTRILI